MEAIMHKHFPAVAAAAVSRLDAALGEKWRDTAVHMTFGAFMGGLAMLLVLLLVGVPIVGS
jgi:hypothetical protein